MQAPGLFSYAAEMVASSDSDDVGEGLRLIADLVRYRACTTAERGFALTHVADFWSQYNVPALISDIVKSLSANDGQNGPSAVKALHSIAAYRK